MFGNQLVDLPWGKIGHIGQRWQLLRFAEPSPQSWENYWADQRKYWGADTPNKATIRVHFGETNTEENLLNYAKKGYVQFNDYRLHWNGLCKVGETVQVISIEPSVIVLSRNWKGDVSDYSDLEICLKEEITFFSRSYVRFCCEIYSFGTITVPSGSIDAAMGARVGSYPVSHRRGSSSNKNETVSLNSDENTIAISDAHFRIVS